jgi:GNAT superfamily N-acetyltransferase
VEAGICFVAELDGKLVGTGTLYAPERDGRCEAYRDPGRWHFGQFAVEPDLQGSGLGSQLLAVIELAAAERGANEIALDTAEGATHLIDYYAHRGYEPIGTVDWESTNYVSVVMSKKLR